MKIVLIHGQNHIGTTCQMGRMLAEKISQSSDITEFFLPRDLNHFCVGCYTCIEQEEKCPFWQDKKKIMKAMEEADIFIFTTPNYCLAPSGAMKSFLDLFFDYWMVHRPKPWMFKKQAFVLSASAGASCKKALKTIKDSLFYWGVPIIKTYGIPVQAANWNSVTAEKKAKIEKHLTKLASSIPTNKAPHIGLKTKIIFNVMKMMHEKGWDSSPVEKEYWRQQGWLDKTRPWKNQSYRCILILTIVYFTSYSVVNPS